VKLILEPTDKIVELRIGDAVVPARIWQGESDAGIEVHAYITRVAVAVAADQSSFEAALGADKGELRADLAALPTRLVL